MMIEAHPPATGPHRILILDVTSTLLKSKIENFHHSGFTHLEYQTATSAGEFEQLIGQHTWNLIICYYTHSPFETTDLLRQAQRLQPQTPVIVVGSQVTPAEALELGRLGVRHYVETSDTQSLLVCVQQSLSSSQTAASMPTDNTAEQQLRLVLDSMQDAIVLISLPDRRPIFVSSSYERVFGYPAEVTLKDPDFYQQVVPPDDIEMRTADLQAVYRDGSVELDHRVIFPNGDVHWLHRRAWIIYDRQGNPIQLVDIARDITERKQAEAALQEANRMLEQRVRERTAELEEERNLLRTVIDAVPDFIYVKDMQHRMLLNNEPHARSLGGVTEAEVVGKTDFDFFPPHMAAIFWADEDRLYATEEPIFNSEERSIGEDGSEIWALTTKVPLRNLQGDLMGLVGITRDITAIKAAGEALRISEARYRLLASNVNDLVARMSPEGILSYCSPSSFTLLGYLPDEMVGRSAFDFVYPDDAPVTLAIIRKALAEKTTSLVVTQRMVHKTGALLWVEIGTRIILDEHGVPFEITGVLRDITERKQAEERLRNNEERYHATVAAMSEGLVVQGADGAIELCNSAAERILGLTAAQMIGRDPIDPRWRAIHEDGSLFPRETHPDRVTLRTGEAQANVVMGVHKPDDTLTWVLINSQPLIDPVDRQLYAVVATFADITAPKQAEAAIKAALLREKELGELKSRFVSMASHEFRNPLASILAAAETLTIYWERMDKPKIMDRLQRIHEQVDRMTEIMEDVLQLSRLQTGRTKFEPVPGDLDALCERVVSDLAELPDNHDRIQYTCLQRPLHAVLDPRLLQQTISNLLHNALKYSAPETSVKITLSRADGHISLRIADQGIGIPEDDMKHMFEPFHRAANVGDIHGTGLGLAIAKEALELHGGSITVESQVNVGTTFTITLPDRL